jgi:GYF domain 2
VTYFVRRGDDREGPFAIDELAAKIRAGELTPDDQIRAEDEADWARAASRPDLAKLFEAREPGADRAGRPAPPDEGAPAPDSSEGWAASAGVKSGTTAEVAKSGKETHGANANADQAPEANKPSLENDKGRV